MTITTITTLATNDDWVRRDHCDLRDRSVKSSIVSVRQAAD